MNRLYITLLLTISPFVSTAFGFCGFFVAKADTKLFNQASKVVLVRDENRTVLTMANDFQGEVKDFAIVVPVPVEERTGAYRRPKGFRAVGCI